MLPKEGTNVCKDKQPSEEATSESFPPKKDGSESTNKNQPSTGPKERSPRRSRSRERQSSRDRRSQSRSRDRRSPRRSRERHSPRRSRRSFSRESRGQRKSPVREKESSADERWNASVEMFLQQYGLKRDEFHSESRRRHSSGQERYSPSDLSPRYSRTRSRSRSRDHSRRSSCRRRLRSRSRQRSTSSRHVGRTERRHRPRSRSGSPTWRFNFRVNRPRSRTRSRSRPRYESLRRRSRSPSYRRRLRSIERELNCSPDFIRRSPPPRRFHYSSERRSSPPQRSWDRFTDRDRFCPRGRRSRRSWSLERSPTPTRSGDLGSPQVHRMQTPLDGPRRPRWERSRPRREPKFSFEGGVWADEEEDVSLEKYKDW